VGIIDDAINWALTIANDGRSFYSQSARHGPYGYDCSSFVSYAYINAGVSALQVSTTGTMLNNFKYAGFTAIPYPGQTPITGDVLFFDVKDYSMHN
jgi:cell wall-associated NlpC family hydrolase